MTTRNFDSHLPQRTFEFQPPSWRTPDQLNARTGALLLGSLIWVYLYLWLGRRLWLHGMDLGNRLNLSLIAVCIGLGVALAIGWRNLWPLWINRWTQRSSGGWPGLDLARLQALSPSEFEEYVAQRLFARQGYQVFNTPDVKDGGIDVLVVDDHGRQAVVQCKRYAGTVGESTVRDLYGTMVHTGAAQAYLVTTGRISDAAQRWAADKPIGLIDGPRLAALSKAEPGEGKTALGPPG